MKASTVLEGLLAVKEAVLADRKPIGFSYSTGICHNLARYIGYVAYRIVPKYAYGWKEHSGIRNWPVDFKLALNDKTYNGNDWTGEYGAARLRLLDYLIEQMENLGDAEVYWDESL